jgi:putative exporter of polyketide antibiotics
MPSLKVAISHTLSRAGTRSGMKTGLFLIYIMLTWNCTSINLSAQDITEEFTTREYLILTSVFLGASVWFMAVMFILAVVLLITAMVPKIKEMSGIE